MKNNWRKTIDTINAERFTIPEGWDTREQVAISLECAPEKVLDLLKPGIASGEIERGEFSVWNMKRRQTEKVVCFRVVQQQDSKNPQSGRRLFHADAKEPRGDARGPAKGAEGAWRAFAARARWSSVVRVRVLASARSAC